MKKQVIKAPQWLVDRMESLKKLPRPTLEEVRIQMKASEESNRHDVYDSDIVK